jgi:hypothetical protein
LEQKLKSKPIAELSTEQMIQKLGEFMQKSCDCDCKKNITDAKLLSRN